MVILKRGIFMRWIINHIRGSVGAFLISFLIAPYLYLYHMKKKEKKKKIKDKEYRKIIERQKQYYNSMMRNYIGIRKFQHDIGNQLFLPETVLWRIEMLKAV